MNYTTVYNSMMQHGMTKQAGFNMSALFRIARMRAGKGFDKAVQKVTKSLIAPPGPYNDAAINAVFDNMERWKQAQVNRANVLLNAMNAKPNK